MSLIKFYRNLQNAKVAAFTISELLRENQQGGKITSPTQIRVNELGHIYKSGDIKSEFSPQKQPKMYQKLARRIAGLRYLKDYFVYKLHCKFRIHKNCI